MHSEYSQSAEMVLFNLHRFSNRLLRHPEIPASCHPAIHNVHGMLVDELARAAQRDAEIPATHQTRRAI